MGDVNAELDELLASFGASSAAPTVDYGGVAGNQSFDFLDNFLEEMGQSAGSEFDNPKVDEGAAALNALMAEFGSPVNEEAAQRVEVEAEGWEAVDIDEKAAATEMSLDSSKELRQLKRQVNKANAAAKRRQTRGQRDPDPDDGFVAVQVDERASISLDTPDAIEQLERELMREFSGVAHTTAAEPKARKATLERPVSKPPPAQQPDPKRATLPTKQQPVIMHAQPQPMAVPVPVPIPVAVPVPKPQNLDKGKEKDIIDPFNDDLDKLLDEISPATIKRVPLEEPRPHAAQIFPPAAQAPMQTTVSNDDEMANLLNELDINIAPPVTGVAQLPARSRPSVQIRSLNDLDAVERALSMPPAAAAPQLENVEASYQRPQAQDAPVSFRYSMQLAPLAAPVSSYPEPQAKSRLSMRPKSVLTGPLDSKPKLMQYQGHDPLPLMSGGGDNPELDAVIAQSQQKALNYSDTVDTTPAPQARKDWNYASGWGKLQTTGQSEKEAAAADNIASILNDFDPVYKKQKEEEKVKAKEAEEKKSSDVQDLLGDLDNAMQRQQEQERQKRQEAELERRRQREEEQRRREDQKKLDLASIEEMVEHLTPAGFFVESHKPQTATSGPGASQNVRSHTEQSQEEKEYNNIQRKYKELSRMTGENLWTAQGDARVDIVAITDFIKAVVAESRAVADAREASNPKSKDEIIENCKQVLQTVPGFVSAVKRYQAAHKSNEDAALSGIPVDKTVVDNVLRECQIARMATLKAFETLLESFMYSPGVTRTISRSTGMPPALAPVQAPYSGGAATPAPAQQQLLFQQTEVDHGQNAKYAILYAFRDFYQGTAEPPQPGTVEALSYVPWRPSKSMREYCALSIEQFKDIIGAVNTPPLQFDYRGFADVVAKQLSLMIPITKVIKLEAARYAPFARFPLSTKVFVNACTNYVDFLWAYSKLSKTGADVSNAMMEVSAKKNELMNVLKMLLTILKKMLLQEQGL